MAVVSDSSAGEALAAPLPAERTSRQRADTQPLVELPLEPVEPGRQVPGHQVPADPPPQIEAAVRPRWLGWETVLLLGLSLGRSGVDSVVSLIDKLTQPQALSAQSSVLNGTYVQNREWLDFIYQVVGLAEGFVAPALALLLLARSPGGPGFGIGFTRARLRRDALPGLAFAALIGIPGLGLVWLAHTFGFNTQIVANGLPDVWYRLPVLLVSALQNATSEEIIVMGFLLTRLAQLGWTRERSVLSAAVLRGSYHLYQGFGGFAGNAVMGLLFGWWFTRTRRVLPLLVAHFVIDAVSFIGYVYLSPHISWI